MPPFSGSGKARKNVRFYLWSCGVFLADQVTKLIAVNLLHPLKSIKIIPPFFWLTIRHNSGAAFSLFSDQTLILTLFTAGASILIIWWGIKLPQNEKMMKTALGLVAGGALGNLFDRIIRGGLVVDFLDLHWFDRIHWPTFNVADFAICIGVGLVIIDSLHKSKRSTVKTSAK
jgi:signal peptidase II